MKNLMKMISRSKNIAYELEFRVCKNKKCDRTFRVSKNHSQKFCCVFCNTDKNLNDSKIISMMICGSNYDTSGVNLKREAFVKMEAF